MKKRFTTFIRILKWKDFFPVLFVVAMGVLAGKGLIGSGYFNMHDDLQMMRQLEMEKCFLDGQIPCRWVPDMGYGFGYPLFNFYPPLPYLVGEVFRLVGYSFVDTVKIVFILSFVLSGLGMYWLAKEFFGFSNDRPGRFAGIVSAVVYVWAPYHAVDVYVRGAMNEAWALVWFPVILLTSYKLLTGESRRLLTYVILLALSWFGLLTSHNLMVIIFTPVFAVWCLLWLLWDRKIVRIFHLLVSGIFGFCLSAFFSIPVLMEKGIVATDTLVVGYYEYTAHFASIGQLLFSRFWGYGPSVWMTADDKMSFQVGWFHWGSSILILVLLSFVYFRERKIKKYMVVVGMFAAIGWFAAFMAHPRSTPIWGLLDQLKFVQFPWRFLTIVILSFSFISGAIVRLLPRFWGFVAGILLMLAVLVYSWNYFLPEYGKLGPLTDEEKFSGAAWELQQTAGIYDYLPEAADTAPKEPRKKAVDIVEGEGELLDTVEGTNWLNAKVQMESDGVARINIIDFPNWEITVNGVGVEHTVPESEDWGRMYIDLSEGEHEIGVKLHDTWPRQVGNVVSAGAWLLFGVILLTEVRRGEKG